MEEKKKNKKKIIIIAIIVAIILIGGSIGAYFGYKYFEENKSTGAEWGDTYYAYLRENKAEGEIEFIELDEETENPIMVRFYEEDGKQQIVFYQIDENGQVKESEPVNAELEFLYNINDEKYEWYLYQEEENQQIYTLLRSFLDEANTENSENITRYTFTVGEATTQETLSGEQITLLKFDETFIKPETSENQKMNISQEIEDTELRKYIEIMVSGYKSQEQIITTTVKDYVTQKTTELEQTRQNIENAKAEIEAENARIAAEEEAKREEQERISAEESAREAQNEANSSTTNATNSNTSSNASTSTTKGLTVGAYHLDYGSYLAQSLSLNLVYIMKSGTYRIVNDEGTYTVSGNDILLENGKVINVIGDNQFIYNNELYKLHRASSNQ